MLVKLSEILLLIPIKEFVVGPKPGPAENFGCKEILFTDFFKQKRQDFIHFNVLILLFCQMNSKLYEREAEP